MTKQLSLKNCARMFSDSVRRFLLLGSLGTGLLIVPIGSIAADEYRCELYVKKFMSPRMNFTEELTCVWVFETNPYRVYAFSEEKRDGKWVKETQEYPHGRCWDIDGIWDSFDAAKKTQKKKEEFNKLKKQLKKQEEEFLTKDVKPEQFIVYVFDTKKIDSIQKFGQFKKGNDVTWYKDMREFRGRFRIETKGDMLVQLNGQVPGGVTFNMGPPKNWWDWSSGKVKVRDDFVSRPLQDKRTLHLTGSFGALFQEGTCLNQKMIAD